ncbi:MAG: hypothetical protein WCG91_01815 [Candidatus Shapirobacteria bacterium]
MKEFPKNIIGRYTDNGQLIPITDDHRDHQIDISEFNNLVSKELLKQTPEEEQKFFIEGTKFRQRKDGVFRTGEILGTVIVSKVLNIYGEHEIREDGYGKYKTLTELKYSFTKKNEDKEERMINPNEIVSIPVEMEKGKEKIDFRQSQFDEIQRVRLEMKKNNDKRNLFFIKENTPFVTIDGEKGELNQDVLGVLDLDNQEEVELQRIFLDDELNVKTNVKFDSVRCYDVSYLDEVYYFKIAFMPKR